MTARTYAITSLVAGLGLLWTSASIGATNRVLGLEVSGALQIPPTTKAWPESRRSFSVCAWVRANPWDQEAQTIYERIVYLNTTGLIRVHCRMSVDTTPKLIAQFQTLGAKWYTIEDQTPNRPISNHWLHACATYDQFENKFSLFVNGELAASQQVAEEPVATFAGFPWAFNIGGSNRDPTGMNFTYTNGFRGTLDEVSVWEGALPEEAIRLCMYTKPTGTESNLVAYWGFDDDTGQDGSTNHYDGLLTNNCYIVVTNVTYPTQLAFATTNAIAFQTIQDTDYELQTSTNLTIQAWESDSAVVGDGAVMSVTPTQITGDTRHYRVLSR